MDISRQFVRQKNPCTDGFRWFMRHFQEGADYQPLLDALVAAGRVSDACWLMDQFGPTKAVLEVDALEAEAVVFAGSLLVRGPIEVDSVLRIGGKANAPSAPAETRAKAIVPFWTISMAVRSLPVICPSENTSMLRAPCE